MVLRESGRVIQKEFNLEALVRPELDSGVDGGRELLDFSEAVLEVDLDELERAREALAQRLGPAAVSAAAIIAGNFSKNDRIANGIGIPADPMFLKGSADFAQHLGLHEFRSARNSLRQR